MGRVAGRPNTRSLSNIADAAEQVFRAKGYRAAGISDVAKALGLSHGALYTYVQSKEVLLYLALLNTINPEKVDSLPLPVQLPAEDRLADLAADWAGSARIPNVKAALDRRRIPPIREELGEIIDDLYAFVENNQRLLGLIERCAPELPELFQFYFVERRRSTFDDLATYLRTRIDAGLIRDVPDIPTAARFIVETIAWFAWHRKGDPDSAMLRDDTCRITVHHILLNAFVPDQGES
ncbi:MAG TPA: helix-turn-helix domain-containing protein [Pseudonocardiaceae bacterium]|jgi:AcrR family transcriptional regulator|nr:helix-turn-helix domain-containing protein [Pseudonocardiaceae bacterium]